MWWAFDSNFKWNFLLKIYVEGCWWWCPPKKFLLKYWHQTYFQQNSFLKIWNCLTTFFAFAKTQLHIFSCFFVQYFQLLVVGVIFNWRTTDTPLRFSSKRGGGLTCWQVIKNLSLLLDMNFVRIVFDNVRITNHHQTTLSFQVIWISIVLICLSFPLSNIFDLYFDVQFFQT